MAICIPDTTTLGNYTIVANTAALPTGTNRYPGRLVFQGDVQAFKWWNGSAWVTLDSGTSGSTTFAGLTDVNVATKTDGDLVYYDGPTAKWVDKDPTTIGIIATHTTQIATNSANITALSNQSSVVGTHPLVGAVGNTVTPQSDLYAGDAAVTMNVGDRLLYTNYYKFINTSGAAVNFSLLYKIGGNNLFSQALSLPTSGASTLYPSIFQCEYIQGSAGTIHVQWAFWKVWSAGAGGTGTPFTTILQDALFQSESNPGTDYGTTRQSHEFRLTMGSAATTISTQRIQSILYLTRAP